MADSLGPIEIVDPPTIEAFPFVGEYSSGIDYEPQVVTHVFDQPGLKIEQRFLMGSGARRFRVYRELLECHEYDALKSHFEQASGLYAQFPYTFAKPDGTETVTARYENPNLTFSQLVGLMASDPGVTLLEIPSVPIDLHTAKTVTRFPDAYLTDQLLEQVQVFVPLVKITPRPVPGGAAIPPIYLSNQRCTVDGQLYLPRLNQWSGIQQTLSESSDAAQFTFGNADDVFTQYANQINLFRATVEFKLYHRNTDYLIELWTGYARAWTLTSDGLFVLPCSDGVFELTLQYPSRLLARTCWKVYKGRYCPSTSAFTDCPKDYDSCVARGVEKSFGGVVALPQTVRIKNNSTGVFGFGRSTITSVSIADDTVYQRPIQEVYTDKDMLVNCDVAAGRDESEYYSGLGIVGEGPIGAYSPNLLTHTLDGQPPEGVHQFFQAGVITSGGWRGILGNDPAAVDDYFGLDQAPWNVVPPDSTYAAGLAFAEIRRTDQTGLQLQSVSDRKMQVTVREGIGGWTWTGPGNRVWMPALSNPVWVLINVYLRAKGLRVDPPRAASVPTALMEQHFDVNQAIAAAAICEVMVDKIIGDGQERQFPFRGALKERKALKDWMQEICNGFLGYFTFVNGKLWIGVRTDSSVLAGNAFTQANILYQSLKATPVAPQFNWLVGQFGDEEFAWALNSVTVYDMDHASFLGSSDSPQYLTSTMTFVGISNKSQCGRVITTRLREELGGVGQDEQRDARNLQFRTTILSLKTLCGDIVSLDHSRLPNGRQEGRVTGWTLNPDYSIDIATSCTTDDMYDLDSELGPKPADVPALPVPPERLLPANGLAWMPDHVAPFPGDPLYPDPKERTFDLWQDYNITREGVWSPAIWVGGEMVINDYLTPQPRITDMQMAAGGAISGPCVVYAAVTLRDSTDQPSTPSNLYALWLPAGVNNQAFTLAFAPPPDGDWSAWDLYVGTDRRRMAKQLSTAGALPLSFTFNGPISQMTQELPEAAARKVRVKAKHVWHSGIAGVAVTGVTAPNVIQSNDFIGADPTPGDWVGRILSALADESDGSAPLWNFTVTAFNAATGELTVTPDCVHADPADSVQPGDVLIVRSIATAAGPDWVEDSMWDNPIAREQFNSPGLRPSEEQGRIYRILRGTGAGQLRNIVDNSAIRIQVDLPWDTIPDATSIGIVEAKDWNYEADTSDTDVPRAGNPFEMRIRVDNLADLVALVGGFLEDQNGNLTDEEVAVYREIFIYGQPPNVRVVGPDPGPWQTLPTDQTIRADTSQNDVTIQLIPIAQYAGRTLYISNDDGPNNAIVVCAPDEFLFDGNQSVTLAPKETVRVTSG